FVLCLALTGIMFVGCNDKDYLYKLEGVEIDSVEIEMNEKTGDFVLDIELENKTKENKLFDFTLIELRVDNNESKLIDIIDLNKQTINAKAEKDFSFILDEEDLNVHGVTVGTKVSVYYGNQLLANVIVDD
ncbi:MAG: hypothetical protein IKA36_06365, partial [Clostridia bacterium]|nr:hypothetical protein [Clostridia bacterium]